MNIAKVSITSSTDLINITNTSTIDTDMNLFIYKLNSKLKN